MDFQLEMNPGTGRKVGGGWVAECELSVLLWSKSFPLKLKIWNWTKPNNCPNTLLEKSPFLVCKT